MNTPCGALKYVAGEGSKALGRLAAAIVEDIADRLSPLDGVHLPEEHERALAGADFSLFVSKPVNVWEPEIEAEWLGNQPEVVEDSEVQIYIAQSHHYEGYPTVKVIGQSIDLWPAGVGRPHLSLTVTDWRTLSTVVEDAIAAAHTEESRKTVEAQA